MPKTTKTKKMPKKPVKAGEVDDAVSSMEASGIDLSFNPATTSDMTCGYSASHYRLFGSIPAAVLYNKLVGISQLKSPREDGWFYYTAKSFEAMTGFTINRFTNACKILEDWGIVERKVTFIMDWNGNLTLKKATHFRLLRDPNKIIMALDSCSINPEMNIHSESEQELTAPVSPIYNNKKITHNLETPQVGFPVARARSEDRKEKLKLSATHSVDLNEVDAEGVIARKSPAAPAAPPAPAEPFEVNVKAELPADEVDRERRRVNAEINETFNRLCATTRYKRTLTVQLRQKLKRAINEFGADHLVEMARHYMSDEVYWIPNEAKRLHHFLKEDVLDNVDNSLTKNHPIKLDMSLPDADLRMNILLTAKNTKCFDVLELDPNAPNFVQEAFRLMKVGEYAE